MSSLSSPLHNLSVLVTGGSGFLGKVLVRQLIQAGCQVHTLARSPQPEAAAWGATVLQVDLGDSEAVSKACEGQDIVFHVAAKAGYWGPWEAYYQTNVRGTQHVIEGCLKAGVQSLVYTSTPSVAYSAQASIEGADESIGYADRYLTAYPQTKALAEQLVLGANATQLSTLALRPHVIWGPGDPHILPRLITAARQKRLPIIGSGEATVDMTHVEHAAYAHLQAAIALQDSKRRESASGRPYFISDGTPVKLWPWLGNLLEALDIPPPTRQIPYGLAFGVGQASEWIYRALPLNGEPRLTRFTVGQLGHSHYFDIRAARKNLQYAPYLDLEKAFHEYVAHLKAKQSG